MWEGVNLRGSQLSSLKKSLSTRCKISFIVQKKKFRAKVSCYRFSFSFKIERNMIALTAFFSIMNQTESSIWFIIKRNMIVLSAFFSIMNQTESSIFHNQKEYDRTICFLFYYESNREFHFS